MMAVEMNTQDVYLSYKGPSAHDIFIRRYVEDVKCTSSVKKSQYKCPADCHFYIHPHWLYTKKYFEAAQRW